MTQEQNFLTPLNESADLISCRNIANAALKD